MIVFGTVPSRRLGRSLGVNNIPPKICTYSCIYCQIGRTKNMQVRREEFYQPEEIVNEVKAKFAKLEEEKESVDYATFVPDGEPTLDSNLYKEIELLRPYGVKIAVITNASLIWDAEVRKALFKADWVSFKVDAISENIWRGIDRPHRYLKLEAILDGMLEFSTNFRGTLVTETMLIRGVNDGVGEIDKIALFLTMLSPDKCYIGIPTRPPAEKWVKSADEKSINIAYQTFSRTLNTEYLIGYEGNSFASTGNAETDLLSITSVHPMRKEGVEELLIKANSGWEIVEKLVDEGNLVELEYEGKIFYMRKLPGVRRF